MRINRQIRVLKLRVIGSDGEQIGIISTDEALGLAQEQGLDLVEVVPTGKPPVAKIIDYGKYRYDQTKREKESKKAQHQIKVKEVKVKPNIDEHDFNTKVTKAREFLVKGWKVKLTCMFRGRENVHPEIGERVVQRFCETLEDVATPESNAKRMGRTLTLILAPGVRKKKV
ncbi:MAG: translation initiation factor IF-3 [Chlamydiia bacterium]|nr:translation initiation factor IF-3 [Chlamydiia bacterium]